jgi:hypothetical protein
MGKLRREFSSKKVPKSTRLGTEVGRKCVMFEELSRCQIVVVLGKTRLRAAPGHRPMVQRVACFRMRATCSSRQAELRSVRSARWFSSAAIPRMVWPFCRMLRISRVT